MIIITVLSTDAEDAFGNEMKATQLSHVEPHFRYKHWPLMLLNRSKQCFYGWFSSQTMPFCPSSPTVVRPDGFRYLTDSLGDLLSHNIYQHVLIAGDSNYHLVQTAYGDPVHGREDHVDSATQVRQVVLQQILVKMKFVILQQARLVLQIVLLFCQGLIQFLLERNGK